MQFKRYVIEFITPNGNFFHCVGSPKDSTDISNAYLMDEKALKKAVAKNCYTWVGNSSGGADKVAIPYRIVEVNCTIG